MSIYLNVTMFGFNRMVSNLRRAREISGQAYAEAINKTALEAERQAKLSAPVGFSGSYRSSITTDQANPIKLKAAVGTNLQYALYIEYDTRPHFPPLAPLKLWAQRKLGNVGLAYAIAKKIARVGTKGKKVFQQTAQYLEQRRIFRQNMDAANQKVIQTARR